METRSAPASRACLTIVATLVVLFGLAAILLSALTACSTNNSKTSTESQYASQFESLKEGNEFLLWASTLEGDESKAVIPRLANTNVDGEVTSITVSS